jgi:hypothetical protein
MTWGPCSLILDASNLGCGALPKQNQLDKFRDAPFPTKDTLRAWFGLMNTFKDFVGDLEEIDAAFSAVRKKNAPWIVTQAP